MLLYSGLNNCLFVLPKLTAPPHLCLVTNKDLPMSRILPFLNSHRPVGKFVHVEFGNPKKRDCAGFGICNVEMTGSQRQAQRPCCEHCKAIGHLSYVRPGNRLVLQFRRTDLTNKAYARHFAAGAFLLEEDFSIAPAIAQACGLPQSAVFLRGRYPFREWGGNLQISFPNTSVASHAFPILSLPRIRLNS